MNLDDQLRAALGQEADMQYATPTRRGRADHWRAAPSAAPQPGAGRRRRARARAHRRGRVRRHAGRPRRGRAPDRGRADVRADARRGLPRTGRLDRSSPAPTASSWASDRRRRDRGGPDLRRLGLEGRELPDAPARADQRRVRRLPARRARRGVRLHRRRSNDRPGRDPAGPRAPARQRCRGARSSSPSSPTRARPRRPAPPGPDPRGVPDDEGYRVAETPRGSRGISYGTPAHRRRDRLLGHGGGRRRGRGRHLAPGRLRRRSWSTGSPGPPSPSASWRPSPAGGSSRR